MSCFDRELKKLECLANYNQTRKKKKKRRRNSIWELVSEYPS